jgi:hypothetical protein
MKQECLELDAIICVCFLLKLGGRWKVFISPEKEHFHILQVMSIRNANWAQGRGRIAMISTPTTMQFVSYSWEMIAIIILLVLLNCGFPSDLVKLQNKIWRNFRTISDHLRRNGYGRCKETFGIVCLYCHVQSTIK